MTREKYQIWKTARLKSDGQYVAVECSGDSPDSIVLIRFINDDLRVVRYDELMDFVL